MIWFAIAAVLFLAGISLIQRANRLDAAGGPEEQPTVWMDSRPIAPYQG